MKKIVIWLLTTILILTSCTPSINNEDEVVQNEDETQQQQNSIVSSHQLSDENYRTILPYRPSASRGVTTNQLGNRVDIDELETGLRRLSKEYFDPEQYFFEEGQYLTSDMLYNWLDTYPTDEQLKTLEQRVEDDTDSFSEADLNARKQALNPPLDEDEATKEDYENNPKYVSHILEQNFLKRNEDDTVELVGASIGIALKSTFTYEVDGNTYHRDISQSEMLEKGKEIAQTVLERVRNIEELSDVPIMIALYREEDQNSPVPGNYVAKTGVEGGQASIGEWETVDEENVLFPSDEGEEKYYDTQQLVQNFGSRIEEYFPNYVGVIGKGFYKDEELQKLTLEIPLEFYGKGEVIGFTQYTYGLVEEMFQDYYDLEVRITSNEKMESFIYWGAGDNEGTVHIYDS
ncbi:Protein involved in sex pheromone biosynthesis [Lentibacillus halodurans]|uniref:Protein involved in sex pheromone biosynthesis n=1 Tax=Lentibacillus halodurans TaxID=237679 RepID=A0A1I0YPI8_9BACI|nr:CamS family sex pheromone protein [Lentibacillus halodurans]SFB15305.1 Protein involved in sex pheromone biosynthesis [Lentibacillus halodurans]